MQTDPDLWQSPSSEDAGGASATVDALVETLRTTRLTVLIGAPGSGKTRLLRDGVLRQLRRRNDDLVVAAPAPGLPQADAPVDRRRRTVRPRELVVFCDRWDGPPADTVHARLDEAAGPNATGSGLPRLPVALRAKALSAERGARLLFVFDHGDRLVAAPSDSVDPAAEFDALVNALCSVSPSVHLLLSAREDALPPSVQSRLGSPDVRVVRLSDPAIGDGPPGASSAQAVGTPMAPRAGAGAPLRHDDIYASIANRLGRIADRSSEAGWDSAISGPSAPDGPSPAPPAMSDPPMALAAPAASGAPGAAAFWQAVLRPSATPPAPAFAAPAAMAATPRSASAPAPSFPVPDVGAGAAPARWSRRLRRRAQAAGAAVALLVVAAAGALLWQDDGRVTTLPGTSASRSDAAAGRVAHADRPPPAAEAKPKPKPNPPESTVVAPAQAAVAASNPSAVAAASAPLAVASTGTDVDEPLADELWREMARHGVARIGLRVSDGPAGPLAPERRLAVLPYDALQPLAAAPGTARVVAPLFTEEIEVIARADSPLAFIHQIAGRRVDLGPPASARHSTAVAFYERLFGRAPTAAETSTADLDAALVELLDDKTIDAIVLPEPQPSAWWSKLPAAQARRMKLLGAAADDPSTRRALRGYLPATLSAPSGRGGAPVKSFAVMTFLVADLTPSVGRDDTAAVAAQALCRSLPELRRSGHPKWREVDPGARLPVPLAYDAAALAVGRACDAGREAPGRRPALALSAAENDNPRRGERQ